MSASHNDNGTFKKGHGGRKKGSRNRSPKGWDSLKKAMQDEHVEKFNETLNALWSSSKTSDKKAAAELFLKALNFFMPKLANIQATTPEENITIQIVPASNSTTEDKN